MKYALSYPEPLRTKAVHAGNQQTLITDAPSDNGGLGEAYSPTDLVAVGLASCIMTILGLRAKSRGLTIDSMEANTEKKMSPNPRRIGRIEIELTVKLLDSTTADQDWLRAEALACPVAESLHPDLQQKVDIRFD